MCTTFPLTAENLITFFSSCTVVKEPGLYWRLNGTSKYSERMAEYSSEYDANFPLGDVSWGLDKYDRPFHFRLQWLIRRKWAFRRGLFTSPEIYEHKNKMDRVLRKNNTMGMPVLQTGLVLITPTPQYNIIRVKNATGKCFWSLKKIYMPREQPYWGKYLRFKEFYYTGESASFSVP